jgi:hypothetical protein
MEIHVSPAEVTPKLGQGALDTWRFPPSAWVAGLIKPAQSPDAGLETRLGANQARKGRTRTSVLTSANLGRPTEDSQGFKPDLGDPAVRNYRGATGNVRHGGNENPSCNRKSRNGNPPPKAGRARALSQPSGSSRGQQGLSTTCPDSSNEAKCRSRREPKGSGT